MSQLPNLYYFNATCEMAIANGTVSWRPNRFLQQFETDLGILPAFFADDSDWLILNRIPSQAFIDQLKRSGFNLPTFVAFSELKALKKVDSISFNELRPWGWSAVFAHYFKHLLPAASKSFQQRKPWLLPTENKFLYSRAFSLKILSEVIENSDPTVCIHQTQQPIICRQVDEFIHLHEKNKSSVLKLPWSSSGRGINIVRYEALNSAIISWATGAIKAQGYIMCEPFFEKLIDFSFQFEITEGGVNYLGLTIFKTDAKGKYIGHFLNKASVPYPSDELEFIQNNESQLVENLQQAFANHLLGNYFGVFGVDAMLIRSNNQLKIQPCVEINLRHNMGYLALQLAKLKGAEFNFFGISTIDEMTNQKEILMLTELTPNSVYAAYLKR